MKQNIKLYDLIVYFCEKLFSYILQTSFIVFDILKWFRSVRRRKKTAEKSLNACRKKE
jgi:hypothetical protein